MVARVLFPWLTSWGAVMGSQRRATIKALPTTLAPTAFDGLVLSLMHIGLTLAVNLMWGHAAPTKLIYDLIDVCLLSLSSW